MEETKTEKNQDKTKGDQTQQSAEHCRWYYYEETTYLKMACLTIKHNTDADIEYSS